MKITRKQLRNPKFLKTLRQPVILLTDFKQAPQTSNQRGRSKTSKRPAILLTDLKHLPRTLTLQDSPNITVINGLSRVSSGEGTENDISQTGHNAIQTVNEERMSYPEDLSKAGTCECVEDTNSQTSHHSGETIDGQRKDHIKDHCGAIIDKNKQDENAKSNNNTTTETTNKSRMGSTEVECDENHFRSCDNAEIATVTNRNETLKCSLCCKTFLSCDEALNHVQKCINNSKTCRNNFIFRCTTCNENFPSQDTSNLSAKIQVNGITKTEFVCDICSKSFRRKSFLQRHLHICMEYRMTKKYATYVCNHCTCTFHIRSNFIRHLKRHEPRPEYACSECKASFKLKRHLSRHMAIHDPDKSHHCLICGVGFDEESTFKNHLSTHRQEYPFECDLCGGLFKVKPALATHMKTHFGKTLECVTCKAHQKLHLNEKLFLCLVCKRSFRKRRSLYTHMKLHSGEKFVCDICKTIFNLKVYLAKHMVNHSEVRPFACSKCDYSCTTRSNLIQHLKVHEGNTRFHELPFKYKCHLCGKAFRILMHFTQHMKLSHGLQIDLVPEKRTYSCDICAKTFNHRNSITNHFLVHSKEKPFKCSKCEVSFKRKHNFDRHMKVHDERYDYQCAGCEAKFTRRDGLMAHLKCKVCEAS